MISGAHAIVYRTNSEADRNFFRNVLKFPYVDAGDGWLIFALPPACEKAIAMNIPSNMTLLTVLQWSHSFSN